MGTITAAAAVTVNMAARTPALAAADHTTVTATATTVQTGEIERSVRVVTYGRLHRVLARFDRVASFLLVVFRPLAYLERPAIDNAATISANFETMNDCELPVHVRKNRAYWDAHADAWIAAGERAWQAREPDWGCWDIPESSLHLLPDDMTGMAAIELGCGTAYVSAWMARRGARVVGIDNSERQLAAARRLALEHGIELTLLHGNAEAVPCADGAFDFAISEYGAAIWCDPALWIAEAHRLLKPSGQLVFLGHTPWAVLCMPPSGAACEARLHRSYFDLGRIDWSECEVDPGGIEFNLPISRWFALFREAGFEVVDYLELQAPAGREDRYSTPAYWAERWPSEHVWKLRRR